MKCLYLNANSVDPDQTPRSVASDLGLHCLPMSLLWNARLKWVKEGNSVKIVFFFVFFFHSEKESTLKGKNLLPVRSKFSPFRVDLLFEENRCTQSSKNCSSC